MLMARRYADVIGPGPATAHVLLIPRHRGSNHLAGERRLGDAFRSNSLTSRPSCSLTDERATNFSTARLAGSDTSDGFGTGLRVDGPASLP
jgi:hypothetical protein